MTSQRSTNNTNTTGATSGAGIACLPGNVSSSSDFCGVRFAQSLVFCFLQSVFNSNRCYLRSWGLFKSRYSIDNIIACVSNLSVNKVDDGLHDCPYL
jgi:hypothetical protein